MDDNSELARNTALQVWMRTRIAEARQQAEQAREAAVEMDDPTVASAALQLAEDLDGLAAKWSARLRDATGRPGDHNSV